MPNQVLLDTCSRIFLIDGQPIDFPDAISTLEKVKTLSDAELFARKNALGDDSIHFQQMRAYIVSKQLLEHWSQLLGPDEVPQVAIVGSGFSGLTSAFTLLKLGEGRIKVTLFEHHHDVLPRFFGARGRRVHPYHHLRHPKDEMWPDLDSRGSATWPCPIHGADRPESGGIENILAWRPGSIEDILSDVRAEVASDIAKFVMNGDLTLRTQTTVLDIQPNARDPRMMTVREKDMKKARLEVDTTVSLDSLFAQEPLEVFDAVIVAPGGARDKARMAGQNTREYWNPLNVENLPPGAELHQFAIIGSGNSAASEVFN